jgi:hypothetical protein
MNNNLIYHLFEIFKQINTKLEKFWFDLIYGKRNWKIIKQFDLKRKEVRLERKKYNS